jgi:hypothetical protein
MTYSSSKKCWNCTFKVNFLCQKSTEFFQKKSFIQEYQSYPNTLSSQNFMYGFKTIISYIVFLSTTPSELIHLAWRHPVVPCTTYYLTLFGTGGYFYSLVLFGLEFVSWLFIKTSQTFSEVKDDISRIILTPRSAYWKLPLVGAKDDHFFSKVMLKRVKYASMSLHIMYHVSSKRLCFPLSFGQRILVKTCQH